VLQRIKNSNKPKKPPAPGINQEAGGFFYAREKANPRVLTFNQLNSEKNQQLLLTF